MTIKLTTNAKTGESSVVDDGIESTDSNSDMPEPKVLDMEKLTTILKAKGIIADAKDIEKTLETL